MTFLTRFVVPYNLLDLLLKPKDGRFWIRMEPPQVWSPNGFRAALDVAERALQGADVDEEGFITLFHLVATIAHMSYVQQVRLVQIFTEHAKPTLTHALFLHWIATVKFNDAEQKKHNETALKLLSQIARAPEAQNATRKDEMYQFALEAGFATLERAVKKTVSIQGENGKKKGTWAVECIKAALIRSTASSVQLSACARLRALIRNQEAQITVCVEIVHAVEESGKELLNNLLLDLAKAANKHVGTFIFMLTNVAPQCVLRHISVLIKMLDDEDYTVRNAVISSLGRLVTLLHGTSDIAEGVIGLLLERVRDRSAYCRAKALVALGNIVESGKLPKKWWTQTLEYAQSRMLDCAAFTRKSALSLVAKIATNHPFGPDLTLSQVRDFIAQAKENGHDELRTALELYSDFLNILELKVFPLLGQLLRSKSQNDVLATMDVICVLQPRYSAAHFATDVLPLVFHSTDAVRTRAHEATAKFYAAALMARLLDCDTLGDIACAEEHLAWRAQRESLAPLLTVAQEDPVKLYVVLRADPALFALHLVSEERLNTLSWIHRAARICVDHVSTQVYFLSLLMVDKLRSMPYMASWCTAAQAVMDLSFACVHLDKLPPEAYSPEELWGSVLRSLLARESMCHAVIFLVGHLAIKTIELLDYMHSMLKKRSVTRGAVTEGIGANEDETMQMAFAAMQDRHLMARRHLCGSLLPLIEKCATTDEDACMRRNATLTLYKLMVAAGPHLCATYIPRVLTPYMENASDVSMQHNAVLALGDLLSRHPNECERSNVMSGLSSLVLNDTSRPLALKVLTRLVLNDMLRPRTALLSDVLRSVTDDVSGVLARDFLSALHSKGKHGYSVVYNTFGEVISEYARKCSEDESADPNAILFYTSLLSSDTTKANLVEKVARRMARAYENDDDKTLQALVWSFQGLLTSEKALVKLHDVVCTKTFFSVVLTSFALLYNTVCECLVALKKRPMSKDARAKLTELSETIVRLPQALMDDIHASPPQPWQPITEDYDRACTKPKEEVPPGAWQPITDGNDSACKEPKKENNENCSNSTCVVSIDAHGSDVKVETARGKGGRAAALRDSIPHVVTYSSDDEPLRKKALVALVPDAPREKPVAKTKKKISVRQARSSELLKDSSEAHQAFVKRKKKSSAKRARSPELLEGGREVHQPAAKRGKIVCKRTTSPEPSKGGSEAAPRLARRAKKNAQK